MDSIGNLQSLRDPVIIESLNLLLKISTSSRKRCVQMIQNSVGGHMTMTSTSSRLLSTISVSKPVNCLIISAVKSHLQHYSDGGHFVIMLTVMLVTKFLKLNICFLSELLDRFLIFIVDFLRSNMIQLDVASLKHVTMFVKSILNTKPLCRLNNQDLNNLSRLLVKVFVNSVELDNWEEYLHIICETGSLVLDTKLFPGLLLPIYQLPKHKVKNLQNKSSPLTVVLVIVSMTGDTEEITDHEYEISSKLLAEDTSLGMIMNFCLDCKEKKVDMVFCQKVIHPRVKAFLYSENILPVDRLGSSMFQLVHKLTACQPLRCFQLCSPALGYLDSMELLHINQKSFMFLRHKKSRVSTLLLTNQDEESVQELKAVCSCALHSLVRLTFRCQVLPGGGCWETMAAHYLRYRVMSGLSNLVKEFKYSKSSVITALEACCTSLLSIAKTNVKDSEEGKTDNNFHHFWKVPQEVNEGEITCSCGMYSSDVSVLTDIGETIFNEKQAKEEIIQQHFDTCVSGMVIDQLDMCLNGVRTAFLTANAVLSTRLYINEKES